MTYHLTPMSKQQHPASSYEGLHLGTHRIRLSQRFAARLTGVRRVQLSCDAKTRIICLTPSKTQKGPAGPDTFRMTKNARGVALIHCSTLRAVRTTGRYRFVRQTREGYICTHEQAKPAGKR
jgi:hypothetical protein